MLFFTFKIRRRQLHGRNVANRFSTEIIEVIQIGFQINIRMFNFTLKNI
ncbi:Uncharacterised protein [Mycobacteroides abscessus subsp. abscessus]|nr:Uncharacterised protein [Mycobacteroides abscessus subsp. abscessus]